jgi:uncharacterized protein
MSRTVRVIYTKYDRSLHWHLRTQWLGEDEHGVWTGVAKPTVIQKGDDEPVALQYASVMLFPRGAWWTASFNDEPASTEIYCDITTPARWPSSDVVTMVDLDLDVIRKRDGLVILDDEDEFAEHQVRYGYPADVVAEAEASARWLHAAVTERREPFAAVYRSYLAMVAPAAAL